MRNWKKQQKKVQIIPSYKKCPQHRQWVFHLCILFVCPDIFQLGDAFVCLFVYTVTRRSFRKTAEQLFIHHGKFSAIQPGYCYDGCAGSDKCFCHLTLGSLSFPALATKAAITALSIFFSFQNRPLPTILYKSTG